MFESKGLRKLFDVCLSLRTVKPTLLWLYNFTVILIVLSISYTAHCCFLEKKLNKKFSFIKLCNLELQAIYV